MIGSVLLFIAVIQVFECECIISILWHLLLLLTSSAIQNVQNCMQKDSAQAKILSKVVGGATFFDSPCIDCLCTLMVPGFFLLPPTEHTWH